MKWLFFLLLWIYPHLVFTDRHYYQSNKHYEDGHLGEFPVETYRTTRYLGPKQNVFSYQKKHSCAQDDLYTLITPRGKAVPFPGPMVLDPHGSLIWTDTQYRQPYNLQVQTYQNEPYLTFWTGDDNVRGHGQGTYYMLNASYDVVYNIEGANDFSGDLHEFAILPDSNTALITIYPLIQGDLRSVNSGPADGWVWDAGFQEIDIETGQALFEWKASDHIPFEKSYATRGDGYNSDEAYDWFHINSVDKDAQGNYLISSRYTHAIYCISGTTGEIIWQLGGKENMFTDVTNYNDHPDFYSATMMARQHDARWRENYTSITFFDNGIDEDEPSIGLWIDIDVAAMTVETRQIYVAPNDLFAESQGNMLVLESGNVLLGFGHESQYTEFSKAGQPLCNVHFGPSTGFRTGAVESYRVEKGRWVGQPNTPPDVVIETDYVTGRTMMYVSWMGATEVRSWRLDGKGGDSKVPSVMVDIVAKDGFETAIDLSSLADGGRLKHKIRWRKSETQSLQYFRAVALDANGIVLGQSAWFGAAETLQFNLAGDEFTKAVPTTPIIIGTLFGFISITPCLWLLTVYVRKLRKQHRYEQVPTSDQKPGLVHRRKVSPATIGCLEASDRTGDLPLVSPRRTYVLESEDESDTAYDSDGGS